MEEKACPSAAVTQEEDTRLPQDIWYVLYIHNPVSLSSPVFQPEAPASITAGTRGTFQKSHNTQNTELWSSCSAKPFTVSKHGLVFKQEALF